MASMTQTTDSCDYSGLKALAKEANEKHTESEQIKLIEEIAKSFPDIKQTRSGATYGGKKRRSKKGGANKALVHTLCLMMIGATAYSSFYLGVAVAARLGYFDAAQRMYDLASSAIAGCGELASGLARGQASTVASSAGINQDLISCSSAWTRLETAQARLMELTRMYGQMAAANGIAVSVVGYSRLYAFVESVIDGSCPSRQEQAEDDEGAEGTGGARRRRTYKKKRGGARRGGAKRASCGMSGGKKRKSRKRKSRGRKSRRRKSRGRKSRRRKSRRRR